MSKRKINLDGQTIFVTGVAGFIGANLVLRLIETCHNTVIVGVDNLNDYYDVNLKYFRLSMIREKVKNNPELFMTI